MVSEHPKALIGILSTNVSQVALTFLVRDYPNRLNRLKPVGPSFWEARNLVGMNFSLLDFTFCTKSNKETIP